MNATHAPPHGGYRAPRWLRGPHAQTIWPAVVAPRAHVAYRRERLETPDGDFIDVDHATGPGVREDAPLLVLFHGLEGSSASHYATALMAMATAQGWRGAVAHFRGCSGEPNRAPRAYHSGDSAEIDWILRRFASRLPAGTPLMAAGVSLGANALLKWLGEQGGAAGFVTAAVAVSPPQDLAAGAVALSRGFNRVYMDNFLRTLKRKSLAMLERHPGLFDRERMLASRDFFDFDDAVTAPVHGFASCHDYWARSSCRQFLGGVHVPTLVINALNDPFLPASALAPAAEVSREVTLEYPSEGGHVGFLGGRFPGRFDWLPSRARRFLSARLPGDGRSVGLSPAEVRDTGAHAHG
jgi:predicted alpha/beta-fold hydrolase